MHRHNLFSVLVAFFLCCAMISCKYEPATNNTPPPDAFKQNERLGRGGNLGNILYQFDEWDKETEVQEFDLIKETGFNNVRICIGPFDHCDSLPPFTLVPEFFERLDWAINEALKRDLTVIIDQHEYHAMADDPMGKKEMFESTWKQIAEHYRDYPDNVYFGLLNEPNGNLTPYLWNFFCADIIKVVRESNPNRTLVVGPGSWNGIRGFAEFKLPEDDRNIIVDFHYYSPHRFTHQGVRFEEGADAWLGTTWTGAAEEKQAVLDDYKIAVDWAEQHNRPLFLGEFGVYRKADPESKRIWLTYIVEQAEANNISWSVWDLMGDSFGIYDDSLKAWIGPYKEAILPARK